MVATIAFAWLIGPFVGAVLWSVIVAILFAPLNARLLRARPGRRNFAALITFLVIVALVIIPAMLLGAALLSEASSTYARLQSGEIDLSRVFIEAERHLPQFARHWLSVVGLSDFDTVRSKISQGIANSYQTLAGQAFIVGQSALGFVLSLGVMLYLTFFLLRDGETLITQIERCLPLAIEQRRALVARFVAVVRATIKGSVIVAIIQGVIGGLVFWSLGIRGALLWGVAMGIFSLFPAVGTAFIWFPVALYLLATGYIWQAVALFLCGILIISSVDNLVRPILVGHEARMPDYVVLITTLGGFEMTGFNGFVIGPVIAALFVAVWEIFAYAPGAGSPRGIEIAGPPETAPATPDAASGAHSGQRDADRLLP
ncbi:MAG TPA: AI-2E family transporter [Rhizomicrobium sp.]